MKKIAVISAILENPEEVQADFNKIVANFKDIVKGRMGLPFEDEGVASISITVMGEMDEINKFTGRLGQLENITVKTAVSKRDF